MAPAVAKFDDIPVVDLASCADKECLETVTKACEEFGCFRIINHGIAPDVFRNADLVCRDVFSLPTETKKKNVSPVPFASYVGGIPFVPFYESLAIDDPDREAIKDFSLLMWPHGNPNFCEIIEEYMNKMRVLSSRVHQIILESLGLSKYYASHFDHGKALFHMNMYDVPSELSTESIGLTPHTDGNSVTILYEDQEGGLQVWNKAGNLIEVKAIPNTIVIFLGDCFKAWSNGRIE
ncbi:hypothetical protein KI387_016111, partial [Taxus chinensis]